MANLTYLQESLNPEDLDLVEGAYGFGPRIELAGQQKADKIYDINFDALLEANPGLGPSDINPALARFIAYDRAMEAGITDAEELGIRMKNAEENYNRKVSKGTINPDIFLYKFSNVAPKKGPLSAFSQFFLEGATKAGITFAPGIATAKTASKVVPGRLKKPAALAGFVGGMLVGDTVAEKAVESGQALGLFEGRPLMPSDRPYAAIADVAGFDTATVALAPYLLPKSGFRTFSGLLTSRSLLRQKGALGSLFRSPFRASRAVEKSLQKAGSDLRGESGDITKAAAFASEIPTTLGAATAAGIAQAYDPGDETTSALSQVGGGVAGAFTPTSLLLKFVPSLLKSGSETFGESARQAKVGLKLVEMINKRSDGETVEQIIADLEANPQKLSEISQELLGEGLPELTPAQISGSPILSRFENDVVRVSGQLNPDRALDDELVRRQREGLVFAERLISGLRGSGNEPDMKLAATIEATVLSDMLQQQFITANDKAIAAAEKLRSDDADVISNTLFPMLKQIDRNAKRQEQVLYEQVDATIPVGSVSNTVEAVAEARDKYLIRTGSLPADVERELREYEKVTGIRIFEDKLPPALIKARTSVEDIPDVQKQEYAAFKDKYLGVRSDPQTVKAYLGDLDMSAFGTTKDSDQMVLEIIASRRQRGFDDKRFKRFEAIAKKNIALTRAEAGSVDPTKEALKDLPPLTFSDLRKFRTSLRNQIEDLMFGDNPDKQLATALGDIADGVNQDMTAAINAAGGSVAYERAVSFSKARSDAIFRTFAGSVNLKDRNNAYKIAPSLFIDQVTSGGISPTALRIEEIVNAGNVVGNMIEDLDVPEELIVPRPGVVDAPKVTDSGEVISFDRVPVQDIVTATDQVVKYAIRNMIDYGEDEVAKVNPAKAARFLRLPENQKLLEMFPSVKTMIEDGAQLEIAAKLANNAATKATLEEVVAKNDALAKVINYDNPIDAISDAVDASKRPYTEMQNLIKHVKNSTTNADTVELLKQQGVKPDDVMAGFKSAILEVMWANGGGTGGKPNFAQMKKFLFGPMSGASLPAPGTRSMARDAGRVVQVREMGEGAAKLSDLLKSEGVFTSAELDRLEYILDTGSNVQVAEAGGAKAGEFVSKLGENMDAFVRWLGAGAIGKAGEQVPGLRPQGLVEAGIGARVASRIFNKVPQSFEINLLEKAASDPTFMVTLLQSGKNSKQKIEAAKRLRAYLAGAGYTLLDGDIGSDALSEEEETYMRDRRFKPPIKPRPEDVPLTPDVPYGIGSELNPIPPVSQAPPSGTQPALVEATAPSTASALAQAPSSPQNAARMAAAFPNDGIMGLLATRA